MKQINYSKIIIFLFITCCLPLITEAQDTDSTKNIIVKVNIKDKLNNTPVSNAIVQINHREKSTKEDGNARFSIQGEIDDALTMEVDKTGYHKLRKKIYLRSEDNQEYIHLISQDYIIQHLRKMRELQENKNYQMAEKLNNKLLITLKKEYDNFEEIEQFLEIEELENQLKTDLNTDGIERPSPQPPNTNPFSPSVWEWDENQMESMLKEMDEKELKTLKTMLKEEKKRRKNFDG